MTRRVVTGHQDGKAVFLSDGAVGRVDIFKQMPGMQCAHIAATAPRPVMGKGESVDANSGDAQMLPLPGETRLVYLQVPPMSVVLDPTFDPVAASEEFFRLQPEMAALQEADAPGMHRTETIDYIIVLDGEIDLELDDGETTSLKQHDVVIQNGTRHAWRNRSDRPALLAVVLVGADRA